MQYDLAALLDQQPVRVCGVGAVLTLPSHRGRGDAMELVEWLVRQAARQGAAMALLFSHTGDEHQPVGVTSARAASRPNV